MSRFEVLICFCAEKEPDTVSRGIMELEGIPFSHTLCLFVDYDGRKKFFHSNGEMTLIEDAEEIMKDHVLPFAYWVPLDDTREEFLAYVHAEDKKRRPYSQGQLVVNQFFRMIGIPWVPFRNRNEKRICCEEMYILVRRSPFARDLQEKYDQDVIGLRQWWEYLRTSEWTRREFNPWP